MFVLNLAWEYLQMPLYLGGIKGLFPLGPALGFLASMGDVVMGLLLFVIVRTRIGRGLFAANGYLTIILLGIMLAAAVESYALHIHLWKYSPLMPLLPWLGIGLSPLLQMELTPPLAMSVADRLMKDTKRLV